MGPPGVVSHFRRFANTRNTSGKISLGSPIPHALRDVIVVDYTKVLSVFAVRSIPLFIGNEFRPPTPLTGIQAVDVRAWELRTGIITLVALLRLM